MLLRVVYSVLVEKKYKSYINCSSKDCYVTVLHLVSGESEEVGVKQTNIIPLRVKIIETHEYSDQSSVKIISDQADVRLMSRVDWS